MLLGLMVTGPAWSATGRGRLAISPPWQMFSAVGRSHCRLELTDSAGQPVDRYGPYDAVGWWDAPEEVTWISTPEHARALAHSLCPSTETSTVELTLQCPAPSGWGPAMHESVTCSISPGG